jgi:hypothetical protein
MQHALASPTGRTIAIGGLLLALTLGARAAQHSPKRHLALHTQWLPNALYLTAWRAGDVAVPFDGKELVPLKFTTVADVSDGCRWLGTETLVPIGPRRYSYRYEETILSCRPDAQPYFKTPRTGCVTVETDE